MLSLVVWGLSALAEQDDKAGRPSQVAIDKAIEKGAEYLKPLQAADGSWEFDEGLGPRQAAHKALGHTGLVLLTLLAAGADPDDPAVARGFKCLVDHKADFGHTYNSALVLMALEKRAIKKQEKALKPGAEARRDPAALARRLTNQERELAQDLLTKIAAGQLEDGSWSYQTGKEGATAVQADAKGDRPRAANFGGDLSNTQYALLGLRSGTELGGRVNPDVWIKAAKCFLDRQEKSGPKIAAFSVPAATPEIWGKTKPKLAAPSGTQVKPQEARAEFEARGWGYTTTHRKEPYGSVTLIGIASVTMCKFYSRDNKALTADLVGKLDRSIEDGCAWVAANFSAKENVKWPEAGRGPMRRKKGAPADAASAIDGYYMYSLERAGILANVDQFGSSDWYSPGARFLVDRQAANGSWAPSMWYEAKATVPTCFAILFLKRATLPFIATGTSAPAK